MLLAMRLLRGCQAAYGALLPTSCLGCGECPLARASQVLCGACRRSLQRRRAACCSFCMAPLPDGAPLHRDLAACAECRQLAEPVRGPPRLCVYGLTGPLARCLAAAKFGGQAGAWPAIARLMWQDERARALLAAADACAFVPSHSGRLLARGYEQAGLLALALARRAGKPLLVALAKVRATPPQSQLPRAARADNVAAAFAAACPVAGLRLVLVDDVSTTGATLRAAQQVLLEAKAAQVVALCLATPPVAEAASQR